MILSTFFLRSRRHRRPLQILTDLVAWVLGLAFAQVGRYDFAIGHLLSTGWLSIVALGLVLNTLVGVGWHLYRDRYIVGSFEQALAVFLTASVTTFALLFVDALSEPRLVPMSVPIVGGTAALVLMLGVRYAWRLLQERHSRPDLAQAEPLLLFGAGEGAEQVIRAMLRDPNGRYVPVAVLDDAARKRHLQIRGVPVLGNRTRLAEVATRLGVKTMLVAIPSADASLLRSLTRLAEDAGLSVKVLPPVADLFDERVSVSDIRDIDVVDLLGRRQVETDLDAIAGYLTGKRVLVTGAGGSIGSELCRQIHRFNPAELIMLDRDESALHAVQLSITGRALLDSKDVVLADIRDIEHLNGIFEDRRPQVVFHAAALKHLPLLEQYPGESIKSNVWGSLSVLKAAAAASVERFVNISTDKAANPVSVLGYSKRIAERLTSQVARQSTGTFLSVRFGNVLGSRGSVLTSFTSQIAVGGPVTVTDPEVTRYFMTIQEAVQLVIQAGAIGEGGEVLVLDMGEPVRVADVATRLVNDAPRPVQIVFTGLRPGEKLHEDLFGIGEPDHRPVHPLISHVDVPEVDPIAALSLDAWAPTEDVRAALQDLALSSPVAMPIPSRGAFNPTFVRGMRSA